MNCLKLSPFTARFAMACASLAGLFASAYLLYTYVSGAPIACGALAGCEVVRMSKWASTFGVPRPLLGILFYVGIFGLLVIRVVIEKRARFLYRFTMLAAAIGFVESAFLFFVQWLDLKAFCLWCIISALAATVIALVAPFDHLEEEREVAGDRELKKYFILLLIFTPLAFIGFAYLLYIV